MFGTHHLFAVCPDGYFAYTGGTRRTRSRSSVWIDVFPSEGSDHFGVLVSYGSAENRKSERG